MSLDNMGTNVWPGACSFECGEQVYHWPVVFHWPVVHCTSQHTNICANRRRHHYDHSLIFINIPSELYLWPKRLESRNICCDRVTFCYNHVESRKTTLFAHCTIVPHAFTIVSRVFTTVSRAFRIDHIDRTRTQSTQHAFVHTQPRNLSHHIASSTLLV